MEQERKIVCLGAEAGKEFRFIFHIFMFCLGLKAENSLCLVISIDRAQTAQSQDTSINPVHFD